LLTVFLYPIHSYRDVTKEKSFSYSTPGPSPENMVSESPLQKKKAAVKNHSRFSFLLILVTGLLFKSVMPFLEMPVRFQLRLI